MRFSQELYLISGSSADQQKPRGTFIYRDIDKNHLMRGEKAGESINNAFLYIVIRAGFRPASKHFGLSVRQF